MTIKITAPIEPVTWSRPQFDSRSKKVYNKSKLVEFENTLGIFAKAAMRGRPPLSGEVKLSAKFYRPKPKSRKGKTSQVSFIGDTDRYLNAVLDALQGICYFDDRQVTKIYAEKIFGTPHVEIELEAI